MIVINAQHLKDFDLANFVEHEKHFLRQFKRIINHNHSKIYLLLIQIMRDLLFQRRYIAVPNNAE